MKLDGNWTIVLHDETAGNFLPSTATFENCSDVELLDIGPGWVRFVLGEKIYLTKRAVVLSAELHPGERAHGV